MEAVIEIIEETITIIMMIIMRRVIIETKTITPKRVSPNLKNALI